MTPISKPVPELAALEPGRHVVVTTSGDRGLVQKLSLNNLPEPTVQIVKLDGSIQLLTKPSIASVTTRRGTKIWTKAVLDSTHNNYEILGASKTYTSIGSDPEIFALDEHGEVIPAFTFLPRKEAAVDHGTGTHFYDGFQAEWTTKVSTVNPQCLSLHIDRVREGMRQVWLAAKARDPKATLSIASVVPIPEAMRTQYDPEHFQLGCSPSLNVYGEEPLRVEDPVSLPFRSAGWHMHFGLKTSLIAYASTPDHLIPAAIRMLDRIVGVAMVSLGQEYRYPERRTLYGRAGEYRYGNTLEYRVPEVLLGAHPATWNLCWELARQALWLGLHGLEFLWDAEDDEVRHAINKLDVAVAQKILKRNEPMLRSIITRRWGGDMAVTHTLATIYEGIGYAVADPTNLVKNWRLDDTWFGHNHNSSERHTWGGVCRIAAYSLGGSKV